VSSLAAIFLMLIVAGCTSSPTPTSSRSSAPDGDPTSTIGTAPPAPSTRPAATLESAQLPSAGGTCSQTQVAVLPITSYGPGASTWGTEDLFVTARLLNVGGPCVLHLPAVIGVAAASGPFTAVSASDAGTGTAAGDNLPNQSADVPAGRSISIVIGASWPFPASAENPTALPEPSCARPIQQVERIEFPLATGALEIVLPIAVPRVCASPASISLEIKASLPVPTASPGPTARLTIPPEAAGCPVTTPRPTPPDLDLFGSSVAYGNVYLWVGGLGDGGVIDADSSFVQPDGSISWKLGWYRLSPGTLTIAGTRLDQPAPPLRADIPSGYGAEGFQASGVIFPTPGCWQITGTVGQHQLPFVPYVALQSP
jgi:hypothetical protein